MRIIVQKFGGVAVSTYKNRLRACWHIIKAIKGGFTPVVVVSAIGRAGEPYATDTLIEFAETIPKEIERELATGELPWVDVERWACIDKKIEPRELDLLISCGEIISTVIMAHTIMCLGYPSIALTGSQAGIITDYNFGDARIVSIDSRYIKDCIKAGKVVIVAGFQGVTQPIGSSLHGAITTLGRGGSDTTAAALGVALDAERVEIYTHVDGVMTADPELVADARPIRTITYEELCEMSHQGAKVVNPRAAELALQYKIPLIIKSALISDGKGTLIVKQRQDKRAVVAIANSPEVAYFEIKLPQDTKEQEIKLYKSFADAQVSIAFPTISKDAISFVVDSDTSKATQAIIDDLGLLYRIVEACHIVSAIGYNMRETTGIMPKFEAALQKNNINVLQVADSQHSIAALIRKEDLKAAVNALHRAFKLSKS